MIDLSKIVIEQIDKRTLRGTLKLTVEVVLPTDDSLISNGKDRVLFYFFDRFYSEIIDSVFKLLKRDACRDCIACAEWQHLLDLISYHKRVTCDLGMDEKKE